MPEIILLILLLSRSIYMLILEIYQSIGTSYFYILTYIMLRCNYNMFIFQIFPFLSSRNFTKLWVFYEVLALSFSQIKSRKLIYLVVLIVMYIYSLSCRSTSKKRHWWIWLEKVETIMEVFVKNFNTDTSRK